MAVTILRLLPVSRSWLCVLHTMCNLPSTLGWWLLALSSSTAWEFSKMFSAGSKVHMWPRVTRNVWMQIDMKLRTYSKHDTFFNNPIAHFLSMNFVDAIVISQCQKGPTLWELNLSHDQFLCTHLTSSCPSFCRRIAMLSLEALKRDWPGVGRSYFGEIEDNPLVSLGSNKLEDPVLLRLLCGAVSPVEATQFWAPVLGFLY